MERPSQQNFRDKYIKQNFITKYLVDHFFKEIQQILKGVNVRSILELGCGEGFSAQYLRSFFPPEVIFEASDLDQDLVNLAASKNSSNKIKFSQESIYSLKRDRDSFDLVIAMEVLEHLDNYQLALTELCRVSKKYVLVTVPWEPWWRLANMARGKYLKNFGNTPGHLNHWDNHQFKTLLSGKFRIIGFVKPFPWQAALLEKKI